MKWHIFIDESGSISTKKKEPFLVTLIVISDANLKNIKNITKKKIRKIKAKLGINNQTELKAADLNKNNWKKKEHYEFNNYFKQNKKVKIYGSFLWSGIHLENTKWIDNPNLTFNFLVKLALERILEREKNIQKNDVVNIIIDNRNVGVSSFNSLQDYLSMFFVLEKERVSKIIISYVESHKKWEIQLADLICNFNWKKIWENKMIKNLRELKV